MAKKTINIGSGANSGNGDPLRVAFSKINDNFTELYALNGSGDSPDLTELVEDYIGNMLQHSTLVGITATYNDTDNKLNFTVNIDGGNASSSF